MSVFYEPWTPEIGNWVDVYPSPECQVRGEPNSAAVRAGMPPGHRHWEVQKRGVVHRIYDDAHPLARQGHRFLVVWDEPVEINGEPVFGASYAAAELVLAT